MTNTAQDRRHTDTVVGVLVQRIDGLCGDVGEMKTGMTRLADAMTKLAVVEERQTQTILAQERAFGALERVEERQRLHERSCAVQDKEVRGLIADSAERLGGRIAELEKAEPMQAQTSKWVTAAVWGVVVAVGTIALMIAQKLIDRSVL